MAHRAELTADQRSAIDDYIKPPADATIITIPPAAQGRREIYPAAVDATQQAAIRAQLVKFRIDIATSLGHDFEGEVKVAYEKTPPSKPGSSSVYLAQAWSDWAGGVFGDCLLTVFDSATSDSAALVSAVLAHEMFHCFQFDAYRTLDLEAIIPAWVMEGQAAWVGEEIGGPSGVVGHWKKYLQAPYVDLRQRTY